MNTPDEDAGTETLPSFTQSMAVFWPGLPHEEDPRIDHETIIVAERRIKVWRLYLEGKSYQEICDQLKINFSSVKWDLKHVLTSYRLWARQHSALYIARRVAELEMVKAEALAAWKRSCEPLVRTKASRRTGKLVFSAAENVTEQRDGDRGFLDLYLLAGAQQDKLLGLPRPVPDQDGKLDEERIKYITGVDPKELV